MKKLLITLTAVILAFPAFGFLGDDYNTVCAQMGYQGQSNPSYPNWVSWTPQNPIKAVMYCEFYQGRVDFINWVEHPGHTFPDSEVWRAMMLYSGWRKWNQIRPGADGSRCFLSQDATMAAVLNRGETKFSMCTADWLRRHYGSSAKSQTSNKPQQHHRAETKPQTPAELPPGTQEWTMPPYLQ